MQAQTDEQRSYSTNGRHFGEVTFEGKAYALTQTAYAVNHGTDGGVRYRASAIDADGNTYRVEWETTRAWDAQQQAYRADPTNVVPNEDESDACDWSSPVSVVAV